ncbi:MAG TPA: type V CRISPR-associated endonuclease Cas1 [Spirochaetota bacterium]|nr:type V CRISPR-associated endonuclease Cas1 [Caldisericia bacterium]HRU64543.1 type V CRISPR-associated endonuclease Cas1 [Spirochaetota bacterium]
MLSLPDFIEKTIVICFTTEGQTVSFKNDNLLISDKDGKTVLQFSCYRIFSLWIVGNTTLTSGILQRSKKFGFSIYLFSYGFRVVGVWNSAADGNFLLREKQYNYDGLNIAGHIVHNKIKNQIILLKNIRNKNDHQKDVISELESYLNYDYSDFNLKNLLGIEGITTKLFFREWFKDLDWHGRKPRTKIDITNTLLDIGYTFLFNMVDAMLNLYGFDVFRGVYHRSFYQRKSLVCDLVEPFRCIIDNKIRKSYNLGQIKKDDFLNIKGQYILRIDKNKEYTGWLLKELVKYKEDIFLYVQKYYRCFMRGKDISEYPEFLIKE